MKYNNTPLFEIPYSSKTDDNTGWMYQDDPYGGFLVYDFTEVVTTRNDREVRVPLAITVEFTNLEDVCGEPGFMADANLTPIPELLSQENLEKVSWDTDENGNPLANIMDVAQYGFCIPLDNSWGEETWEDAFDEIKSSLAVGTTLSGFVLDRAWNRLGTTGWELLDDALFNEDAFDATIERLRGSAA